jgi:peptidoglycan/LPS O-acetylase OafA/YrhL
MGADDARRSRWIRARWVRRSLEDVASDEFRPDVEGLRAFAVIVVVAFHLGLARVGGGFVGVDVFFVLSGFLITRVLVKELSNTGRISLRSFWARRARRLLPASTLVIVVTVLASRWALSPLRLRSVATDAIASAVFVVNFVFAHRFGDYFGAQLGASAPSPLLHFWSLAVEEQFYLIWPVVLVALTRWPSRFRRRLLSFVLAAATASLLTSMWMTSTHPTWAFYLLPARAGELLAGAALAVAGPCFTTLPPAWRAVAGWFGMFGVAFAVVHDSAATPFPGTAVLVPVLGTVLVIIAGGDGSHPLAPGVVLGVPALQWVGRRSYAIYLWHWPALVLAEAKWGPLAMPERFGVVAAAVGVAVVTHALIEDPVRHSRWLAWRPSRGLALGGALCSVSLVVGAIALSSGPRLDAGTVASAPVLPSLAATGAMPRAALTGPPPSDAGPEVADPDVAPDRGSPAVLSALPQGDLGTMTAAVQGALSGGLATTEVPSNLRPELAKVNGDRAQIYADGCVAIGAVSKLTPCRYGSVGSPTKVVLFGDSHAAQWFPALEQIAEAHGLELVVLTKGGCPNAVVGIPTATLARTCPIWRDAAIAHIAELHPTLVITSSWAGYPNDDDEWRAGFGKVVGRLMPISDQVVVLGDNPHARAEPAGCLSGHVHSVPACTAKPEMVVAASRLAVERAVAESAGARYIDTTDWLCTPAGCPVIVGDILLFRDSTHLTTVATSWLRPVLEAAIAPSLTPRT